MPSLSLTLIENKFYRRIRNTLIFEDKFFISIFVSSNIVDNVKFAHTWNWKRVADLTIRRKDPSGYQINCINVIFEIRRNRALSLRCRSRFCYGYSRERSFQRQQSREALLLSRLRQVLEAPLSISVGVPPLSS